MVETHQSTIAEMHLSFTERLTVAGVDDTCIMLIPGLHIGFDAQENIFGVRVLVVLRCSLVLGGQGSNDAATHNCVGADRSVVHYIMQASVKERIDNQLGRIPREGAAAQSGAKVVRERPAFDGSTV